ncbi:hypothetical protein [Demequina litorisediminis]|uniref:Uncharacterized protein n=1 Tax=Demequina litorisediminis TaxID=1849022 RepID=A0ABQ6IB79_9MICO|nr:hypothetical protein [Demequina litorisediminis]GMA34501.1 hypothetical protein GCM10025876_07050 [Demequina litorisediminis]
MSLPGFAQAADAAAASAAVTEASGTPAPSEASAAKVAVASALRPVAEPAAPAPRITFQGVGKRAEIAEMPCPTCFIDLPGTGICDLCG